MPKNSKHKQTEWRKRSPRLLNAETIQKKKASTLKFTNESCTSQENTQKYEKYKFCFTVLLYYNAFSLQRQSASTSKQTM